MKKIMHKKAFGFTLAEVLITLTIIGVIAALTIPAIISNVQKDMWVQGMKKTHSVLVQATSEIIQDSGGSLVGVFTNSDSIMNTYAAKMSFLKTCLRNQNPGVCFHDGTNSWYTLHGDAGWNNATTAARAIGSDGVLYVFNFVDANCANSRFKINGVNSLCAQIDFDVNGFKGPNTMGRDIFEVELTSQGIYFDGAVGDANYSAWSTLCNPSSTNAYDGINCGHRIMQEGGMNY